MVAKEGESAGTPARVHEVIIKGNSRTNDRLIKAEIMDLLSQASTFPELQVAAKKAKARLKELGIFDIVEVLIDDGPPELPGFVNVVVEASKSKLLHWNPFSFTFMAAKTWSLGGRLSLKNLLGIGDIWGGSLSYSSDQNTHFNIDVLLPKIQCWTTPPFAQASLLTQDWLKLSSYKEQSLGLTLRLLSTKNHDLEYNLTWRTLTDPSRMAGASVRRQLGHNLLSSLKYTYKADHMDSPLRPTQGYALGFTAACILIVGLHDSYDRVYFGVSGGLAVPWGNGLSVSDKHSSLADRLFMGGNASPFGPLGSLNPIWGFKCRGLGPSEPRRQGMQAVSAFADLSFDLPTAVLKQNGIHGHVFASAGNVAEVKAKGFSMDNFMKSFRSSIGCGIVIPIKHLFRMEVNYCQILGRSKHDASESGVKICFSAGRCKLLFVGEFINSCTSYLEEYTYAPSILFLA
ncbi:hypothetical protein Cgig2_004082 [Carnegiea gigantea]|uniref:Bacterial surface antigen (D15) domain-containing protein n=1 Tax=Carnegiea gigantea TaxID=171969 RepID=A0A9Q1KUT7_9CARY|nr:hypothetical protein Cgig2_004082 [Carnegiea gigantea]